MASKHAVELSAAGLKPALVLHIAGPHREHGRERGRRDDQVRGQGAAAGPRDDDGVLVATGTVLTVKGTLVAPDGTVTEPGQQLAAALLLESATHKPLAGAAAEIRTVPGLVRRRQSWPTQESRLTTSG